MIAALILFADAPAGASHVDRWMAEYRDRTALTDPDCRVERARDLSNVDIVVCARKQSSRLPLPDDRDPYDGPYRPVGEARMDPGPPCPPTGCTGVNLLKIPMFLFRLGRKIADPDR